MIQEVGFVSDIASVHSEDTDVHEASTPYDNDMMKVYVRVLPHTSGVPVLTVEASPEAHTISLADGGRFSFNHVFDGEADNARVYRQLGQPLVRSVLDGYNGTLIAYGQTGTGKTYTLNEPGRLGTAAEGLMPRMLRALFADAQASALAKTHATTDSVAASTTASGYPSDDEPVEPDEPSDDEDGDRLAEIGNCSPVPVEFGGRSSSPRRARAPALVSVTEALPTAPTAPAGCAISISLQYVQVYLDKVYDLLAEGGGEGESASLALREDPACGVYVHRATTVPIETVAAGVAIIQSGAARLHFSSTQLNRHSSRSHAVAIFSVSYRQETGTAAATATATATATGVAAGAATGAAPTFTCAAPAPGAATATAARTVSTEALPLAYHAKLTICDLAGSERVKRTAVSGTELNEAQQINVSLFALGNVISRLAELNGTVALPPSPAGGVGGRHRSQTPSP